MRGAGQSDARRGECTIASECRGGPSPRGAHCGRGGGALVLARRHSGAIVFERRSPLTVEPGLEIDPAMSPDGQFVAYAAGPLTDSRIYVRQVDGGRAIAIAPDVGGAQRMPFWSPDGRRILFRSARGIEIAPALGGTAKVLVPGGSAPLLPGPWSPDSKRIAFARNDSLYAMPAEGGAATLLAHGGDMHSFSWSPDGRWISVVRGDRQSVDPDVRWFFGNLGQSAVWIVPASGGQPIRVTDDRSFHASPGLAARRAWAPLPLERGRRPRRVSRRARAIGRGCRTCRAAHDRAQRPRDEHGRRGAPARIRAVRGFSRMQEFLHQGLSVRESYERTLRVTGASIIFTGVTLAIGVATWVFSPLKFQADIGIMLTFMFLVNMLAAIILLPALGAWFMHPEGLNVASRPRPVGAL